MELSIIGLAWARYRAGKVVKLLSTAGLHTILVSVVWVHGSAASAVEPLHDRIDIRLAELRPGAEAPLCSDAEFLRRVYLDLVGTIPPVEQARQFIQDGSPDKRLRIVDQLLQDPGHAKHIAAVFDVMLMERRSNKYVKSDQWNEYLLTSFQQNKPLNELARELLAADGVDEAQRGAAKFYLEREVEPNLITREVGRMFFGMDLQCAQCHDHPIIDDYYQSDYYGLFAFVNRSYLFQPDKKKPAVLAEKAEGDAKFKSVFTEEEGSTLPRLPGSVEIDEPTFAKDDAYQVKPDPKKKGLRPVPKHSRRQQLATRATDGSNLAFNRNLANRLWAHMMGRGLVHPVDQHHSDNPPVHPQLLESLADELVKTKFDVKKMLRELALSRTYQRSIDLPQDLSQRLSSASQQLDTWKQRSEEFVNAVRQGRKDVVERETKLQDGESQLTKIVAQQTKANESLTAAKKTAEEASKLAASSQNTISDAQQAVDLLAKAIANASQALKLLADDKELGGVLKTLQSRHSAVQTKVMQQAKLLATQIATRDQAVSVQATAQKAAGEADKRLAEARETATSLADGLAESNRNLRRDQTYVSHADQQVERLLAAIAYGESVRDQALLKAETDALGRSLVSEQQTIARLNAEKIPLQKELPATESSLAEAMNALATAKQEHESMGSAARLVAESFAKASEAILLLPDDADLKSASDKLGNRSRELSGQVETLAKLVVGASDRAVQLSSATESLRKSITTINESVATATKKSAAWKNQLAAKSLQLTELQTGLPSQRETLTSAWAEQFSIAVIQPLSPEQLANSILQATGYDDRLRNNIEAALDKKSPLKPEEKDDQAKLAARTAEIEKQTAAKLRGIVDRYVKLFAAAGGQPQDDFFATVDQALFFGNGGELRSWLAPSGGNLTDRLRQIDDSRALAEEMYLSILTRLPSEEELADVDRFLSSPESEKRETVQQLAWALLTSAEFRFQH